MCTIRLTPQARLHLISVTDRRVRQKLVEAIDSLADGPEKKGKPLTGEMRGYRSVRSVGQRYRIVYRINRGLGAVIVVAVGLRREHSKKDIYELARKLIRLKLAESTGTYRARDKGKGVPGKRAQKRE